MLFGDGKPQRAAGWPAGRMKRVVASISFGRPPGGLKPRITRQHLAEGADHLASWCSG
jgi:hypothetical protein